MSERFLAQRERDKKFELKLGEVLAQSNNWKDEPSVTVPDDGSDVTFSYGNMTLRMSAEQFKNYDYHRILFAVYFDALKWAADQYHAARSPQWPSGQDKCDAITPKQA